MIVAAYGTKTYLREDLQIMRGLIRAAEAAISTGDWWNLESIARDIEARGSSVACAAQEKLDADHGDA